MNSETVALGDLLIHLPKIDRDSYEDAFLGGRETRAAQAAERKRALDRCGRSEERRDALLEQHRTEDEADQRAIAWHVSSTGRLVECLTGEDHVAEPQRPRLTWWCPSCQGENAGHMHWSPDDPRLADEARFSPGLCLVIEHRFRQRVEPPYVVRAACLAGCEPAKLADACRRFVIEREEAARREEVERESAEVAAEFAPQPIAPTASRWIVPDLLPDAALALPVGPSGGSKTWWLITLAVAVASGRPLLGREVQRGRVLLCLLESHAINYSRIDLIARGLGTSLEELRSGGWLDVWPLGLPLKTDDPTSMSKLARAVRARQYVAILIDNASEIRSGLAQSSENDSTIIGNAMRPLAQLAHDGTINGERVATTPPAVCLLHHAGGSGTARGSTAFLQHADYVLEMRSRTQALLAAFGMAALGWRASTAGAR
ncbi:MAG: AAA family ATPase [Deltaproteobacteria bacterium]|nr:AAA family ATPase [Deltaproteobacteria bacterium]